MKKIIAIKLLFVLFGINCMLLCIKGYAQDTAYQHMFCIYEDNDIIKLLGDVSDKGYTNGTRLDYYYTKNLFSLFFLDKWMPKAGTKAINTFGLSIMQAMYTPEDLKLSDPDVSDWPYTGSLYVTYSLHSSNALKKYLFKTEIAGGVMGKASMVEPLQKFIHSLINADKPMGWDKQYPTDILLNLDFSAEKQLWHYRQYLECIGGAEAMAGTMMNGLSVYGLVRVGKMLPYFNGIIQQYVRPFHQRHNLQLYVVARPSLDWVGYNAVLDGGVFRGKSDYYRQDGAIPVNHSISRRLDLGLVMGYGCVSLSFTQRIMPKLVDGFSHQRLGNLSLYLSW